MALDVIIVSGSGQEYAGCLLLTSEVLFVVSISEDTQQQAFPITEIDCIEERGSENSLLVQLKQQPVTSDTEVSDNLCTLGLQEPVTNTQVQPTAWLPHITFL